VPPLATVVLATVPVPASVPPLATVTLVVTTSLEASVMTPVMPWN
jgi:hypothetical protein